MKLVAHEIGVEINPYTDEPIEYKVHHTTFATEKLKYGSLFLMARFLAQPHNTLLQKVLPPVPTEEIIAVMFSLMAQVKTCFDRP